VIILIRSSYLFIIILLIMMCHLRGINEEK